jgi:Ca2+-binding RTX toxin-like protein
LSNFENLLGSCFNDKLSGTAAVNTIVGGTGDDIIDGRAGKDVLTGGAGADTFVFSNTAAAGNADTITDFSAAEGDTFNLTQAFFSGAGPVGALSASAFHIGTSAAAGHSEQHIIYDDNTGKIFYDADGAGGAAQQLFFTVNPHTALTEHQFVLV